MTRNGDLRRRDIVEACREIEAVVAARGVTDVQEFILQRAAERLLEIIGEAATRCSREFRARYSDVDWPGIAGLRVVLAHHYHRTQSDLVWKFAEDEAPRLLRSLAGS